MRIYAISDVHVDYEENRLCLQSLSPTAYLNDTLILAGDVSDNLDRLHSALSWMKRKFAHVFFVPGNHELWVRKKECANSIEKFRKIIQICRILGVQTTPAKVGTENGNPGAWIVPLFSWYMLPEEGGDSLFVPKKGEDPTLSMWSDHYFTKWDPLQERKISVSDYFLKINNLRFRNDEKVPIISFSHFLPRTDLIFHNPNETEVGISPLNDPAPQFNFSRVAGSKGIERQIRQLGSKIHVYGHQHRNRHRTVEGVLYISHCLSYPAERKAMGLPPEQIENPKLIWDTKTQLE